MNMIACRLLEEKEEYKGHKSKVPKTPTSMVCFP